MAEKTPYDLIEEAYQAAIGNTEKRRDAAKTDKAKNETRLRENLTEENRGVGILYNQLINPFGRNAEQRGVMGSGVSDYIRSAAYGQMVQGRAQNQRTFEDSFDTVQNDFQNYLLELAGLDTQALNTRNTAREERRRYDTEQERLRRQEEEDKRRYEQGRSDLVASAARAAVGGTGGLDLGGTKKTPQEIMNESIARVAASGATGSGAVGSAPAYVPRSPTVSRYVQPQSTFGYSNYVPRSAVR